MKRENLEKALEILRELKLKIDIAKDYTKELICDEYRHMIDENVAKYQQLLTECSVLSNEFYYILPKRGQTEIERLQPIAHEYQLQSEMRRVTSLLEFEIRERMILAARLNQFQVNPLDYIYNAIGCRLEPLKNKDKFESNMIMKYIMNSEQYVTTKQEFLIDGIYRVSSSGDTNKQEWCMENLENQNTMLLWHGTSTNNLLSILKRGLVIDPVDVEFNGWMYGKGIYLSDHFSRINTYCSQQGDISYILLCEAALGNVETTDRYVFRIWKDNAQDYKNYDSKHIPDNPKCKEGKGDTRFSSIGRSVVCPIAEISGESGCAPSEFVIKNENQISIRYLLRIKNNCNQSAGKVMFTGNL